MTAPADEPTITIPQGDLLRSRVVADVGATLASVLDRELTGYATLVPQETLLLAGEARGVITFEDGVPVLAYNTVTDAGGPEALAELAVPGPYRVELYAVSRDGLQTAHTEEALQIAPGAAARELADDPALARQTRTAAPADRVGNASASANDSADANANADTDTGATTNENTGNDSAVAAFLNDEERIAAIREQARVEAQARASEWGLEEALATQAGDDSKEGSEEGSKEDSAKGAKTERF